jgi:outer membrane PBP1 activator LpoA protein
MQASQRALLATLAGALLLVLSGCTPPSEIRTEAVADRDAQRAAELAAAGEHLGAASLYRTLALRFPEQQAEYLLAAAEQLARADDRVTLDSVLAQLQTLPLDPTQAIRLRQLLAERQLQAGDPLQALEILDPVPPQDLELRRRHHQITARAYRLSGNMLDSAVELQALEALQPDLQARLEVQQDILHTLALLSEAALTQLQPSPPGVLGGWMDLALALKRHGQEPQRLNEALTDWRTGHPQHPALAELLDGMLTRLESQYRKAAHIAVLLPESGPYAGAAAAIRDGILAAWYQQHPEQRPRLAFYDASDATRAWPLLGEAVAAGAEAVIGPLDKESVRQLARAGELPVPVLALNQIPLSARPPANFYQFSLAPEDEARQVAERAWLDGHRLPVVLAPDSEWGERVATAFRQRWLSLGGRISGEQSYDNAATDYGQSIQRLLHLDQSKARRQALQRLLGQRLEFEPRRRGDVDFVFVAAGNTQARQLRPQLQFHHAADLPVYTTSHVWDGQLDDSEAPDLKGILLPDMPWILDTDQTDPLARGNLAQSFPASTSAFGRLYAMGMDSLQLLPHLARLQSAVYESLDGRTGKLHMDALHQVHRQLVWTRLDSGGNQVLGYTPRLDLPGADLLYQPAPVDTAEPLPPPPS